MDDDAWRDLLLLLAAFPDDEMGERAAVDAFTAMHGRRQEEAPDES